MSTQPDSVLEKLFGLLPPMPDDEDTCAWCGEEDAVVTDMWGLPKGYDCIDAQTDSSDDDDDDEEDE